MRCNNSMQKIERELSLETKKLSPAEKLIGALNGLHTGKVLAARGIEGTNKIISEAKEKLTEAFLTIEDALFELDTNVGAGKQFQLLCRELQKDEDPQMVSQRKRED